MGGNSSKEMEEYKKEIGKMIERMEHDQNRETNSAIRSQYNRLTELMHRLNERLVDRQDSTQERLERQMNELQEQLEILQKKTNSDNGAGSSRDTMNDILHDLRNIMLGASLSVKDHNNFGGIPQKIPSHSNQNSSWSMGQQEFGPATLHHNYGGQFHPQVYPPPYVPNSSMPHPVNQNMPNFSRPPFSPNYPIQQPPSQQFNPSPGPRHYFPSKSSQPPASVSTCPIPRNEEPKMAKAPKHFPKASSEGSMKKKSNLTMPEVGHVIKESKKSNDTNIINITKRFAESHKKMSKTSQETKPINIQDNIENIIAKLKQQQIDNAKNDSKSDENLENIRDRKDRSRKNYGVEKRDERDTKRHESVEYRRGQYKTRGRGRTNYQEWKDKNRQPRKKPNPRNFDNALSDSDSNESVLSNFSCASKKNNIASATKNKKVYKTTLPNYARDFNFERTKSLIDTMVKSLDLKDYKTDESDDERPNAALPCQVKSRNNIEKEAKEVSNKNTSTIKSEIFGHDENENLRKQDTSRSANLKKINYPSREDALSQELDLQKPLEQAVLFIGLTEAGQHHTHQPKCLAEIYDLEKIYKSRELVSLS